MMFNGTGFMEPRTGKSYAIMKAIKHLEKFERRYKMKVGDKVKRIHSNHMGMEVGDIDTVININPSDVDLEEYGSGHLTSNLEVIKEQKEDKSPLTKQKMTNKKIIKVLAVDKKTGEVLKNISVVAENEQTAILKAFGVDVEKVYIKTTEEGEFEEEKPVKVIMDKTAEDKPKK